MAEARSLWSLLCPSASKGSTQECCWGQGGSCLISNPFPHCCFLGEHIPIVVVMFQRGIQRLSSLPPTPHPMPGLMAGLGHKRLTGRTQEAGDSIYSLWSWGREKIGGKAGLLHFFCYPLPLITRGFVPWEGSGSRWHSVLEGAERCHKAAGRAGLQGEEQKRPVLWFMLGERLRKQSLLLANPPPPSPPIIPPLPRNQAAEEGGQHTGPNPSLFQSLKRHAETHVKSSTGASEPAPASKITSVYWLRRACAPRSSCSWAV